MTDRTPTTAIQDYLKIIYKLREVAGTVTTNAIADRMGVSAASVTKMIKRLAQLDLLEHTPYFGVRLTPAGERLALEVIRHHRLLESYLVKRLAVPIEDAHAEAELLEHVLSESLEDRIAEVLADPESDPHGDPIPTKDGRVEERRLPRLADAAPGDHLRVERVSDADAPTLRQIAQLHLLPGAAVKVHAKSDAGDLVIRRPSRTSRPSAEVHVAATLASRIFVIPA
ncbi:MAG: metal-dependent transcriptional regulator [Armatimonadetes bacterium]|nr:metal-dependent transcriptional regulator [Armatimonadota bacterium]